MWYIGLSHYDVLYIKYYFVYLYIFNILSVVQLIHSTVKLVNWCIHVCYVQMKTFYLLIYLLNDI